MLLKYVTPKLSTLGLVYLQPQFLDHLLDLQNQYIRDRYDRFCLYFEQFKNNHVPFLVIPFNGFVKPFSSNLGLEIFKDEANFADIRCAVLVNNPNQKVELVLVDNWEKENSHSFEENLEGWVRSNIMVIYGLSSLYKSLSSGSFLEGQDL